MANYRVAPGRELRIAISGKSGCGNTTVSTLLAERLGIKLINYTFRQLAAEKGLTLAQVIEKAKNDDSFDRAVDTKQVELARKESCVLGSRLAIWMLKEADVKIYLLASDELRARRILGREGGNIEEIKAFTSMRDREDSKRYIKLYGIDNNAYDFADLKVDTSCNVPDQIVDTILGQLEKRGFVVKTPD
jgi:cytidylate kinase